MAVEPKAVTSREFVRRFKAEIAAHHKLRVNHPFVTAIGEGTVSMDHLGNGYGRITSSATSCPASP